MALWLHVLSPDLCLQPVWELRGSHAASWECPQRPQLAGGAGPHRGPLRADGVRRYFRADAAFAKPEVYEYLEERRLLYAIRLPSNEVLQWEIAPLLRRPVGRPPKKPIIWYDDFWYQAGSWDRPRRVIAKVEWHRGELFPRVGFIVTNMSAGPKGVVHFYNGRGYCRAVDQGRQVRPELDPAVLPQVRGQPGATGSVHPSLQPGELAAQAMPAQGGQALVVAKPPGQTHQDRGEASSPRPAAGVSARRGSSASGGISTSAGAYRRAPSSTRVASVLGITGGDEGSQGGAVRLDELKGGQTC